MAWTLEAAAAKVIDSNLGELGDLDFSRKSLDLFGLRWVCRQLVQRKLWSFSAKLRAI